MNHKVVFFDHLLKMEQELLPQVFGVDVAMNNLWLKQPPRCQICQLDIVFPHVEDDLGIFQQNIHLDQKQRLLL